MLKGLKQFSSSFDISGNRFGRFVWPVGTNMLASNNSQIITDLHLFDYLLHQTLKFLALRFDLVTVAFDLLDFRLQFCRNV